MDEKFTVDAEVNRKISRVFFAYNPSDVPTTFEAKNLAPVVIFGAVASESIMDSRFVKSGLKIATKEYLNILKNSLLLQLEQKFGFDNRCLSRFLHYAVGQNQLRPFLAKKMSVFMKASI